MQKAITNTVPIVYRIADLSGEEIRGTFYERELQRVDKPSTFPVAEILKTRRRRGQKEMFVRWLDYPSSFNSWVRESDFAV